MGLLYSRYACRFHAKVIKLKVIINSKDIWFRLGVEYCLQQIASDYNEIDYAELGYCKQSIREADLIILPLHGYQDYKHIYALSQFYQGIILG